jgi:erythromycin esterase-like protein
MRARISRELIVRKGFRLVAIEGDWPNAARVDHMSGTLLHLNGRAFARFPTWMWRNNKRGARFHQLVA